MLATIPVPEKVWVFGDQISGTFKVNSILHAGQGTRAVNPGLSWMFPDIPGQLAGMFPPPRIMQVIMYNLID